MMESVQLKTATPQDKTSADWEKTEFWNQVLVKVVFIFAVFESFEFHGLFIF